MQRYFSDTQGVCGNPNEGVVIYFGRRRDRLAKRLTFKSFFIIIGTGRCTIRSPPGEITINQRGCVKIPQLPPCVDPWAVIKAAEDPWGLMYQEMGKPSGISWVATALYYSFH